VNDCVGQFVWAYPYISEFVNSDRLFVYNNESRFGFITPEGNETSGIYRHIKPVKPIPTPRNGAFE
jgi:hypothetical protein